MCPHTVYDFVETAYLRFGFTCANSPVHKPPRISHDCVLTACPRFFQRACAKHFLLGYQARHVSTHCLRLREKPPIYNSATTCASPPVHKPSRILRQHLSTRFSQLYANHIPRIFQRASWRPPLYDSATTCANPPVDKPPRMLRQLLAHTFLTTVC